MVDAIHRALFAAVADADVRRIVIEGAGDRAFCAGGDVVELARRGKQDRDLYESFFHDEYRMNQAIARLVTPYVAIIDGVTMGGGVGLSIHGPFRVATERTLFAMPETGIGLIPDVGGTHALPRLPGEIGTWAALTGARLGPRGLPLCRHCDALRPRASACRRCARRWPTASARSTRFSPPSPPIPALRRSKRCATASTSTSRMTASRTSWPASTPATTGRWPRQRPSARCRRRRAS